MLIAFKQNYLQQIFLNKALYHYVKLTYVGLNEGLRMLQCFFEIQNLSSSTCCAFISFFMKHALYKKFY